MSYKCKDCGFETDIEMRYMFHRRYGCYSFHESIAQSCDKPVHGQSLIDRTYEQQKDGRFTEPMNELLYGKED